MVFLWQCSFPTWRHFRVCNDLVVGGLNFLYAAVGRAPTLFHPPSLGARVCPVEDIGFNIRNPEAIVWWPDQRRPGGVSAAMPVRYARLVLELAARVRCLYRLSEIPGGVSRALLRVCVLGALQHYLAKGGNRQLRGILIVFWRVLSFLPWEQLLGPSGPIAAWQGQFSISGAVWWCGPGKHDQFIRALLRWVLSVDELVPDFAREDFSMMVSRMQKRLRDRHHYTPPVR